MFLELYNLLFLTSPSVLNNFGKFCIVDFKNVICVIIWGIYPSFRDLLLPDGNRVSAFSVASTAIAAAQWSSTQVSLFFQKMISHHCNHLITHCSTFQPQQSSDGISEYNYMPDGYPSMTQVSSQDK